MTWPLARYAGHGLTDGGDALLQAWIFAWNSHALATQPTAVWDAPIFYPYPDGLAFTDNHLLLAALTAPLTWYSSEPLLAYNLLLLASFALSGWAVFLLARATLHDQGVAPASAQWAALVAGAAFAFCAYRFAHITHFQLLQTYWMLFALFYLRRLLRPPDAGGGRWVDALLCGLFAAAQVVTALYYAWFTALLLGGYAGLWVLAMLWLRLRTNQALPWRQLGLGALAATLAGLLAWPVLQPYMRVYGSLGIVRSLRELDGWSAPLRAYLTVPQEHVLFGWLAPTLRGTGEMVLFPGGMVTLLALGSVATLLWAGGRKLVGREFMPALRSPAPSASILPSIDRLFWPLIALIAFILSLGTGVHLERFDEPLPIPLPYLLLYNYLPGFGALRVPARWGILVTLACALLAALALAKLLAQRHARTRTILGSLALIIVLSEQAAPPGAWRIGAELTDVPPVYVWLAQPAQDDIQAILELPVAAVPRGAELEQVTWRQWYGRQHWRPLVASYSGLMPFGSSDLLRRAQHLPAPAVVSFLQLSGVDTLIIHREAYGPGEADALLEGLLANPEVSQRAEVGTAIVLSLRPDPRIVAIMAAAGPGGSIYLSADERIPGVLPLALSHTLRAAGYPLYGPGRTRFYEPLHTPQLGQSFAAGLLAADEDPRAYGFRPEDVVWQAHSLALYRGDPRLLAHLRLAQQVPGWFHPHFPTSLELQRTAAGLLVGEQLLALEEAGALQIELDSASLYPQSLLIDGVELTLPPGLSTIRVPLAAEARMKVQAASDDLALLRLRVLHATDEPMSIRTDAGFIAAAEVNFKDATLQVSARAAGIEALRLDIRGAAAYDDRPIRLLAGSQPVSADGKPIAFAVDLLQPEAVWLESQEPGVDGRYIAYLKDAAQPESPGVPIAKFNLVAGQVVAAEPVPLPLSLVP
ncbi:hypothetical protein [Candidatus Viridilinea mediisalina]|nr:hypothetical protein [Candidatus Viridilinea mediisalina]